MTQRFRDGAVITAIALLVASSSGTGNPLKPRVASPVPSQRASTNSERVPAKPNAKSVLVRIDVLSDRHAISSYVYGGSYPKDTSAITDSGLTAVRWGGNATSRYNWQTHTYNAASDWYFGDYGYSEIGDSDSAQFIQDVKAAGSAPLMTMVMLNWVAKDVSDGSAYSFSVAKYGAQCQVNPYNSDDGDGVKPDCQTNITGNDSNDANVPLHDSKRKGDPPGTVYRDRWAASLAAAFGNAPHFYDMDNEMDIWGGTHRDIHPNPSAYDEMRDVFVAEARALNGWDPKAIRFGPVNCCWWYYWNGADPNDKGAHAGNDFLPWWLNEVYWRDQVDGTRSLDIFDVHAYPGGPNTSHYTKAQKRALTVRIFRDFWDPSYVSESPDINQQWATQIQPRKRIPFRIPRLRAISNMIYPGTPLSFTEWRATFAGESDYSAALADADAYGILGRERVFLASRWTAANPANPNYQALKLFRNYDGQHHAFATISVANANDGPPNLFSSYAALNSTGTILTVMVLNKDPGNTASTQFAVKGFRPRQVTTYTLSPKSPNKIVASGPRAWSPTLRFAPYTATLLVVSGSMVQLPSAEWDLNPDTTMVPAGGTVTLSPRIVSGSGTVTLGTPLSDQGITVAVTQGTVTSSQDGSIVVSAGDTSGFFHFTVPSTDDTGVNQSQSGWIVVGNPAATLSKQGDNQKGQRGSKLNLSVTLNPGKSGGSASGATVLFTTEKGTLSSRMVTTDASGTAPVVLTLPSDPGTFHVTAEAPFGLGHAVATFTETSE